MRKFRLAVVIAAFLPLVAERAAAYPHKGELVDLSQPDGTQVAVVVWGDEFYARAVTPNGYTLIVDPVTGYVCYALATDAGDLVSSGIVYDGALGDAELQAFGITKGAVHSRARRDAMANAKRSRLAPNQGKITPGIQSAGNVSLELMAIGGPAPSGAITGLVVLVDFPDRKYTIATGEVDGAFNSAGTYGTTWHGSIRKWSEQISGGITSVQHKIVGYYTANYNVSHYNVPTAEWDYSTSDELYKEVYAYIDANVDLTSYAINRRLPSLALIYAGNVIARGWAMALWPHGGCGGTGYRTSEGITIDKCFLTNLGTTTPIDLETFRHELGHSFFSWPDTYDYDDDSQGAGGYATETDWPCAPFRMWAGWITPTNVTSSTGAYSLAANGPSFLRYDNASKPKEYFIAEYAKKTTYRQPPDQGLLVWHIDENGDNSWQDMTATRHYAMSVEQADGRFDLERNIRAGDGDLFHSGDKTRFDDTTTPSSNWWNATKSGFKVCDIGGITTDTMAVNVGCVAAGGGSGTGGANGVGGASVAGASARGGTSSTSAVTSRGGSNADGSTIGGNNGKGGSSSIGGNNGKGGSSGTGGNDGKGGSSNIGGAFATGGTSGSASRGTSGGTRGSGDTSTTGEASAKGSGGTAGATATKGIGGTAPSTGVAQVGGATESSGGAIAIPVGENQEAGGFKAQGGTAASTMGSTAARSTVGGASTTITGPAANADAVDVSGCNCRVSARRSGNGLALFVAGIVALTAGLRRRRR